MKENSCAFYVHCFAHQLQLVLVVVARKHIQVATLFHSIASIVNIVNASSKWYDVLYQIQATEICESIDSGEICIGNGLNQESIRYKVEILI